MCRSPGDPERPVHHTNTIPSDITNTTRNTMRIGIKLPQDAVPDENPHRRFESPVIPRVGELIQYDDLVHVLIITEVLHNIGRTDAMVDVQEDVRVTTEWHLI